MEYLYEVYIPSIARSYYVPSNSPELRERSFSSLSDLEPPLLL